MYIWWMLLFTGFVVIEKLLLCSFGLGKIYCFFFELFTFEYYV